MVALGINIANVLCNLTISWHCVTDCTIFCLATVLPLYKPHPFFLVQKKIAMHWCSTVNTALSALYVLGFSQFSRNLWHRKVLPHGLSKWVGQFVNTCEALLWSLSFCLASLPTYIRCCFIIIIIFIWPAHETIPLHSFIILKGWLWFVNYFKCMISALNRP